MKTTLSIFTVILFVSLLAWYSQHTFKNQNPSESSLYSTPNQSMSEPHLSGEALAKTHCSACHLFPEPKILPQKTWNYTLTVMGFRLGIEDVSFLSNATEMEKTAIEDRRKLFNHLNLIPNQAAISNDNWLKIREYYATNSPFVALSQIKKPTLQTKEEWFMPKHHSYQTNPAIHTMVSIDEKKQEIFTSNMINSKLTILDKDADFISETIIAQNTGIVDFHKEPKGIYLLTMGDLPGAFPDRRMGAIFYAKRYPLSYEPQIPVLQGLYRPCSMDFADLDGDGTDEIIVCNFGIEKGDLSIYKKTKNSPMYNPKPITTLITDSGTVACRTFDFDEDGLLDIAALTSNANENLSIFFNKGNGKFERKEIIHKHSAFGYVNFHLVDFNKDGHIDIVTVNGDNGDNDPYNTLKNYHGIRIYLNDGGHNFRESFFYPMYGAYGVAIEDFDLDGDFDLAANAFHPDFDAKQREQFVILKQTSSMQFEAFTHPSTFEGRWLTMSAGDLDQDGDKDIVLTAGYVTTGLMYKHQKMFNEMFLHGPSLIYLENKTIK